MEVYLDLFMLLNFGVDLLLLWSTSKLSGGETRGRKLIVSAAFGGIYAGLCLMPGLAFLGRPMCRLLSLAVMSAVAFGLNQNMLRSGAIFVLLSTTLGGIVVLIGQGGASSVILSAILLAGLCFLAFRDRVGGTEYVSVEISHREGTVNLTALLDTGNTLRDPVTGNRVIIVDSGAANALLHISEGELRDPIETISQGKYPGLRLIPYCAVGQPSGLLLGMKPDGIRINGKPSAQIVAFAPQKIGQGSGYQALTGGAK
jgi:stage II sporulation protein GA (sporulation sigma-E factor processing peptidase)